MTDYDLPAELRVALRRAKKKTTLGGAIILLSIFWPISVEIGLLKALRLDNTPPHPLLDISNELLGEILIAAGLVGVAAGIGIVTFGWLEESSAQKRIDTWRKNPPTGPR